MSNHLKLLPPPPIRTTLHAVGERFELTAEALGGIMYDWDAERNTVHRTGDLYRFLGYHAHEAGSEVTWWEEKIHPEDRMRVAEAFFSPERPSHVEIEYRIRHKSGHYLYVWDQARLRWNEEGKLLRVVGSNINITRFKKMEEALREAYFEEQELRTSIQLQARRITELQRITSRLTRATTVGAVARETLRGVLPLVNARAGHLLLENRDRDMLRCVASHGYEEGATRTRIARASRHHDVITRCLEGEEIAFAIRELQPQTKLALSYHELFSSHHAQLAMRFPSGRQRVGILYLTFGSEIMSLSDIDTRLLEIVAVQCGQALARADLYGMEKRLRRVEQEGRKKAEGLNRQKDQFLAVISHELRSPLQAILGWTRMLRRSMLDAPTCQKAYETIERNTKTQIKLINDLLDVSRIIVGKLDILHEPVNLVEVLESALSSIQPMAEAKQITLESKYEVQDPIVMGDSDRLLQVIVNLLTNAVKFTPENGHISLRLSKEQDKLSITLQDTGIGIESDLIPHIFERFRQGGDLRTARPGLGLGLSIVRHLVKLHGGEVKAHSEGSGKGSTFIVTLPATLTPDFMSL